MVISIFTPPEQDKEWSACKTGDICDCLTFEYEKFFNGAGTFTAEIPVNSRFREKVLVNSILVTSDGDALIVKNIQTTLDKVKITGYDLNGLLLDRVTMPTDNDGTDPVSGTTEYCVKHYVSFNLEACEKDINRNLPRFGVAENLDRGIADDHNMPRVQNVHDVVTEMCGAAKLGWRVELKENGGTSSPVFVFDVAEQVDRSVNQSERNRVIFSVQQHNVSSMTREVGVTAAKNALYLDIDGTIVGYPSGDTEGRTVAVGYDRREEYCSLSGDSLSEDVYSVEAEQNMADRMAETDSLTIEAGNPLDYRKRYDVGTVVTVYDRNRSLQLDSVISAVTVRRSGNEYSVKLTLGESKPKVLDQYVRKGEATSTAVRNSKAPVVGLTEYKYLTDLSVKFNGTTYTAEKDGATGLISRISDDAGNEFEPTISSGITDVSMHNAAFLAVAMLSGLGESTIMPVTAGLVGYFDYKRQCAPALWTNRLGGDNIPITGSAAVNAECLKMPNGTRGTFSMPYTDGAMTFYAVLKCSDKSGTGSWGLNYVLGAGSMNQHGGMRCLCEYNETWLFANSGNAYDIVPEMSAVDNYHVIAVTCDARQNESMYIDGVLVGSKSLPKISYGDTWGINHLNNNGVVQEPSVLTCNLKMLAFGRNAHTAEQIATNVAWLKKYYGL